MSNIETDGAQATTARLPAWPDVLGDAEQLVRAKFIFPMLKGTVLENDVPVWIADFALRLVQQERARWIAAIDTTHTVKS